mgnify:CR=1 FL=1
MKWWKLVLIIVGALSVTALGIDAADTITGSRTTLLASLIHAPEPSLCPAGMVVLKNNEHMICVDAYEAGVGKECPRTEPASLQDTLQNMNVTGCQPVSAPGVMPWRFVPFRIAEQLCARAGKTLITPQVWYDAALGTVDSDATCPVAQSLTKTGERAECRSGIGAFDMIGNVWELVSGEVVDGVRDGQKMPTSGYVDSVNDAGLASATAAQPNPIYGNDYFWSEATGTYAMMRGGYYNGRTDAGLFSTQATIAEDFAGGAVGFRCMLVL